MGLRINSNPAALSALRQLAVADRSQSKSLQRLSTGLRINTAADDPSGLVISEQLRAQTASLKAAVRNSEFASNLIGTAEAALNEVSALLVGVRESAVFALNSGTLTTEQIAAEQSSLDQALNAIDRIAASTRFGSKSLLDGASSFKVTNRSSLLDSVFVREAQFAAGQTSVSFQFSITTVASRAVVRLAAGAAAITSATQLVQLAGGGTENSGEVIKFRITGALGVAEITLGSGATYGDFMNQVNANTSSTGVFASGANAVLLGAPAASGARFALFSTSFGTNQSITVERLTLATEATNLALETNFSVGGYAGDQNPRNFISLSTMSDRGQLATDTGADIEVRIDSTPVVGKGNTVNVNLPTLKAELVFAPQTATTTAATLFTVVNDSSSGLTFQFADKGLPGDRISIGIRSMRTSDLGVTVRTESTGTTNANTGVLTGGSLTSLRTGSANDLSVNPANALKIIDDAIAQVSSARAALGSLKANTIDPNISSLNVAIENLTATESSIRDLDFAEETSEFVRSQILFQAAVSTLASANLIPQTVLSLLG